MSLSPPPFNTLARLKERKRRRCQTFGSWSRFIEGLLARCSGDNSCGNSRSNRCMPHSQWITDKFGLRGCCSLAHSRTHDLRAHSHSQFLSQSLAMPDSVAAMGPQGGACTDMAGNPLNPAMCEPDMINMDKQFGHHSGASTEERTAAPRSPSALVTATCSRELPLTSAHSCTHPRSRQTPMGLSRVFRPRLVSI